MKHSITRAMTALAAQAGYVSSLMRMDAQFLADNGYAYSAQDHIEQARSLDQKVAALIAALSEEDVPRET